MVRKIFVPMALTTTLAVIACAPSTSNDASSPTVSSLASGKTSLFRLSLTDAPNEQLTSVIVNIKQAELRVTKNGKAARIIVSQGLGAVDLLTLQNGITLPLADLALPHDVEVSQFRLVLEADGHYIIKADGSRCDLKTPSAQKTGIKFIVNQPVVVERNMNYSMVADFDAHKSVVLTGNGGCLLKPVLKLKSLNKESAPAPQPDVTTLPAPDDSTTSEPSATPTPEPTPSQVTAPVTAPVATPAPTPVPETMPDSSSSTQVSDGNGWDSTQETTVEPPAITATELPLYFE